MGHVRITQRHVVHRIFQSLNLHISERTLIYYGLQKFKKS